MVFDLLFMFFSVLELLQWDARECSASHLPAVSTGSNSLGEAQRWPSSQYFSPQVLCGFGTRGQAFSPLSGVECGDKLSSISRANRWRIGK